MSGTKISALTTDPFLPLNGSEVIPLNSSGTTYSVTFQSMVDSIIAGLTAPTNNTPVYIAPNTATNTTATVGVAATFAASSAVGGTSVNGAAAGGSVSILAGSASRRSSGNANGGDITLTPGAGVGTGTTGNVIVGAGNLTLPANSFIKTSSGSLDLAPAGNIYFDPGGGSSMWQMGSGGRLDAYGSTQIVSLGSSGAYNFTSSSGSQTADTGLARNVAAQVKVTDGSSGIGSLWTNNYFTSGALYVNSSAVTTTPAFVLGSSNLLSQSGWALKWSSSATDASVAADTGLARTAAGDIKVTNGSSGLGTASSSMWWINDGSANNLIKIENDSGVGRLVIGSSGALNWNSSTTVGGAHTGDTGLSRGGAAATVAVGNGTVGDASGTLKLTSVITPAGVALALTATVPTQAASTVAGVGANLTASAATAGSTNAGAAAGGDVTITAGAAAQKTSGNANGGNINLVTGAGIGTGTTGQVLIPLGTVAAPSLAFTGATTRGIYAANGGTFFAIGGAAGPGVNSAKDFLIPNGNVFGIANGVPDTNGADVGIARVGASSLKVTDGGTTNLGGITLNAVTNQTANGGQWVQGQISESLTLSTSGTTTDTTANLLPANSIIEAVVARITTTITTATNWKMGDATTSGRFTAANSTLTAGTTDIGTVHADQTGAAGPRQTAAAKLRVTTTGTPGAGVIRITVFYRQFVPPTS